MIYTKGHAPHYPMHRWQNQGDYGAIATEQFTAQYIIHIQLSGAIMGLAVYML